MSATVSRVGSVTVAREAHPHDARVVQVRLTCAGVWLFYQVAPLHLTNEDRLLPALESQRVLLADLLRTLLASFEHRCIDLTGNLGLPLEPAQLSRARRATVGVSDVPGVLVDG